MSINNPSSHENPDLDPAVLVARHDRVAFGKLYDAIYEPVFRYCIRRTGDRTVAEDLTSAVFLCVAKKIGDFPGRTFQEFRQWTFAIATNEIAAHFRKSMRRTALLSAAVESRRIESPSASDSIEAGSPWSDVQSALRKLSDRDQSIVAMRYFAQLPYEDIGAILQMTAGAVRTAATRALANLRKELGAP